MADLKQASRSSGDRGQLILVTGLTLAVALVILVLLVNTAIYTQNLATRDADVGEDDALAYENALRDGIGGIIDRENTNEYGTRTDLEDNIGDGIGTFERNLSAAYLDSSVAANVDRSTGVYHEGELIRQTSTREFTSAGGSEDWTLAATNDTRAFTATVDRSQLETLSLSNADNGFHVELVGATGTWQAYVYENASTSEISLAVESPSGPRRHVCSVSQSSATVDFTRGKLGGEDCRAYDWAEGTGSGYFLAFENGDDVEGTYNLTVNTTSPLTTVVGTNFNAVGTSPYTVPAVYDYTVTISYETATLEYENRIRIAPGEDDD